MRIALNSNDDKKEKRKKIIIAVISVIIVAGVGFGAYKIVKSTGNNDSNEPPVATSTTELQEDESVAEGIDQNKSNDGNGTSDESKSDDESSPSSESNSSKSSGIMTYSELKEHNSKATVEDYVNSPQDFFMSESADENERAYAETQNIMDNSVAIANFTEVLTKVNSYFSSIDDPRPEEYFTNLTYNSYDDFSTFIETNGGDLTDDITFFNCIPYEIFKNSIENCISVKLNYSICDINLDDLDKLKINNDSELKNKDPYYELIRNLTKIHSLDNNFDFHYSSSIQGNKSYDKDYITGYQTCSYIIPVEDENGNYGYISYNSNDEVISFIIN